MEKLVTFETANGPTETTEVAEIYIEELGSEILPYVLKTTPAVISVGQRCEDFGYSFIWISGQTPFFITPEQTQIFLEVQGNIPYLRPGAQLCQPRELPPHCALCGQKKWTFRPQCMPCTTDDPLTPEAESRNLDEPSGNTASQEHANAPPPSEAELGKPDEPSEIVNHNNDSNHKY